jgi:hypothetical protein
MMLLVGHTSILEPPLLIGVVVGSLNTWHAISPTGWCLLEHGCGSPLGPTWWLAERLHVEVLPRGPRAPNTTLSYLIFLHCIVETKF